MKEELVRNINGIGENTRTVTIPHTMPLKKGDKVLFEKIDESSCKMTKVEIQLNKI